VHFTTTGSSFVTDERADPSYPNGVVGRIGFAIHGTLSGRMNTTAQGTIRLVARFYRGEQEWNACDSLDVAWAVGPRARAGLGAVALGRQIGEYYPAVPNLAVDASPARRRFIARVDETCVATYRLMIQAEDAAAVEYQRDHIRDRSLLSVAYYVNLHAWQLRELLRLGPPPEARALYDAWLGNFRRRVLSEDQALTLREHRRLLASKRVQASIGPLKARGNLLGEKFGLVRCTSNGDRTPIPILSDGQPRPLP
jgi:hypothetical protein